MQTFKMRYYFLLLLLILALSSGAFLLWASNAQSASPEALAALESGDGVIVSSERWLVFQPEGQEVTMGLIFYPGGRVDPRAYAPFARDIARAGFLVVIVPMPLNLALLDVEAARAVMLAYLDIDYWALGGHSLGGIAAAQFTAQNPRLVDGLVLWASFPQGSEALAARNDLVTVSIYGSNDTLTTLTNIEASRALLPPDSVFVVIEGGNHAQFGWYGVQAGDGVASISPEEQQRQTVAATIAVLRQLGTR
ncbi:MAG: alpha/beta hydrolase [Chloroflexi bacterium]|nr:alpha/beta hydrolase [Chloroflexota bacterium]